MKHLPCDRQHQADLLWYLAVQHAELGQKDEALRQGQAAVQLLEQLGSPVAGALAEALAKYRAGEVEIPAGAASATGADGVMGMYFGSWDIGGAVAAPPVADPESASGPGLLRLALSAARSMLKFVGSGFKAVDVDTYQKRLATCASCPQHTGVRCRLCGCFTSFKAKMPHENCPAGKWPK